MTGLISGATLYGEQTRRALASFPIRGRRLAQAPSFVRAYAQVKAAAARANAELGVLDADRAEAIAQAAAEIVEGRHADQFPIPLVQGGGGTSTNMNVNEVLAARAGQLLGAPVHPNDHVNRSQSTNDTYPTAMALALHEESRPAGTALRELADALEAKAGEQDGLRRLGRTCLQDAVALTVGQTHRAHAHAIRRVAQGLEDATDQLLAVPLGATAIGTGVGSPPGYADRAVAHLAALRGHGLTVAEDAFDALSQLDSYSAVAAACVRAALVVGKIAADLRLLSSGPSGGLGEVALPVLQAGSSIMPGKVNPVIPELVLQLGFRIRGAATTVDCAVAAGELELNVMEPVILDALLTALADLTDAGYAFRVNCVRGLHWNEPAVTANVAGSLEELVLLAGTAGYQRATQEGRAHRLQGEDSPTAQAGEAG